MKKVVSCLDAGKVKILLLPLNEFPDGLLEKHIEDIKTNFSQIDLTELTAKEENGNENDFITRKLGDSNSEFRALNFNFIMTIDTNTKEFIDFQLHHRIFGMIGLIYGPSNKEEEFKKIEDTLNEIKTKLFYEIPSKVFIFDTNKESAESGSDENGNVPESQSHAVDIVKVINKSDLKIQFENLSASIVETMSELYKEISQRPALPSPCGIEDYSASRSSSKAKMKLSGRLQKLQADLHLLTGSYSEAVTCYVSANEEAKAAGDGIWSAAAQEGFNISLCLQNEQLQSLSHDKIDIYRILIEKLIPLAVIYERSGIPVLSIDLQITCSRVNRFIGQGSQALNFLSEAWKSCNLLAFDEKIVSYNRILRELAYEGNWRKWAFYMVQMTQTLKLSQKPEIALLTLSKTLSTYKLSQLQEYKKMKGWPSVQSAVLKEMVKLSETHSNRLLYFLYGWMYLACSNRWQDTSDQVQIIENLKRRSIRDMFSLNSSPCGNNFVCSLPIFIKIKFEKGNNGLFVASENNFKVNDNQLANPFIYAPERGNIQSTTTTTARNSLLNKENDSLICGEPAVFKICLNNPFVFPIILKNIYLLTNDLDDSKLPSSEQVSITLPPMTSDRSLLINLVPRGEGLLKVLGFCATFMNVEIQFLIDSFGKILDTTNKNKNKTTKEQEQEAGKDKDKDNIITPGMTFKVISSQPFLKCKTLKTSENLEALQIYQGESRTIDLNFENLGLAPISNINFKFSYFDDHKYSIDPEFDINEIIFGDDLQTFFIAQEDFEKSLPISGFDFKSIDNKESSFTIPMIINGTCELMKSAVLEIFYSSTSSNHNDDNDDDDKVNKSEIEKIVYWRKLVVPLVVTISPIIKISEFSFFPYIKTEIDSSLFIVPASLSEIDSGDHCVGSCVISNLESFPLKTSININYNQDEELNFNISSISSQRIFFLIPRLKKIKITTDKNYKNIIPISEKKIALVRKLRKPDNDEFVDDSFEDFIYDPDSYWIKNYLKENLKFKWKLFDEDFREGKVSIAQCEIISVYHKSIYKENSIIKVVPDSTFDYLKNVHVGQEIRLNFHLQPDHEEEKDYELKIFPVIILGDEEVGLNFERVLTYTGALDSIIRSASSKNSPMIRILKFYPLAMVTIKIIYQVVEMETGNVHWCNNPILIEVNKLKKN